jgi:hypothetical protein
MSGRQLKWLTVGLFASGSVGLLALSATMSAAPALADTLAGFGSGGFHGGDGFNGDTALAMGPSGFPVPAPTYVDAANNLYIQTFDPGATPQPLTTPEGLYPITGVKSLTLDPSVAQGEATLNNAIMQQIGEGNHVDVFGFSQSSTISSLEMSQLHSEDPTAPLNFILVGDPNNPDGGMLERFVGASIPSFGVTASGATPSDLYPTEIITNEYDGFADFPRYPINLLSDLNAYLGILFEHATYLNESLTNVTDLGTYGDTTYYMVAAESLPLLDLLRWIPGGNPLADLLQPDLSILVNLGYGSIYDGWDPGNPSIPTPFGLFPTNLNWGDVLTALVQGIPQGISKAITDIQSGQWTDYSSLQQLLDAAHTFGLTPSDTPTLGELLGAAATYFNGDVPVTPIDWSSPTDIVNGLTSVLSTDISTLLPTADTALALAVSLPNYDASLFVSGLEAGNLLAAIGDPIAADIGVLPLPIGLEAAVLGEALATTGYELIGGLIP